VIAPDGGLTALLLAQRSPGRVLSFVDIEGNLAPEDQFLSRQIVTHPADDDAFIDRNRRAPSYSAAPLRSRRAAQGAARRGPAHLHLDGRPL
jgi:hypothetical protein